jgi:hypothetical protein
MSNSPQLVGTGEPFGPEKDYVGCYQGLKDRGLLTNDNNGNWTVKISGWSEEALVSPDDWFSAMLVTCFLDLVSLRECYRAKFILLIPGDEMFSLSTMSVAMLSAIGADICFQPNEN